MLKGVNKRVVEVIDPENEYFERAILFLKTDRGDASEQNLRQRAGEYLRTIKYSADGKGALGRFLLRAAGYLLAAAAGVATAVFLL